MKKISVGIVCLFSIISLNVAAQQRPHYTQYIMNNFIINPAVAGIENYWDMKACHRQQWVGLDGAPVTTYVTIHGPFKKNEYGRETPTTLHADGDNPRGSAYWDSYTKAEPHLGFGATFVNDKTGPLVTNTASATLAYHFGISQRTSVSFGLSFGFNQMQIDRDKLNFGTKYPNDPVIYSDISNNLFNKYNPDAAAGIWIYSADYFIGVSAQQLLGNKIDFYRTDTADGRTGNGFLVPHIFATAGYRMFLSEDWSVLPSGTLRFVAPLPMGIDANVKFQYRDQLWFGGNYRFQDGFAAMVGMNVSNTFNIGYSYDLTTSQLNTVSRGSHEIVLGLLIGNKFGDWCPRNTW
jgi:type IX secretion system PorP/SprF family membrane protein